MPVNAVGLDWTVDRGFAREQIQSRVPVQGNLDPLVLVAGGPALERAVDAVLEAFADRPFIFNLGHGIVPETPIAHVEHMLARIRRQAEPRKVIGSRMLYNSIKAFHIIAVIAWMAGMLYLPRLFVYHCEAAPGSPQSETFKVMERRLLKAIINPAMVVTWVLGLTLAWDGGWFASYWLQAKIALVLAMSGAHGLFARWVRDFAHDRNRHAQRFYRIINEVTDHPDDRHRYPGGAPSRSVNRVGAIGSVPWTVRNTALALGAFFFHMFTPSPRTQADASECRSA